MEEKDSSTGKRKWYKRLALASLLLFAIFWSLGPFFFWILFGFSSAFVFLAFYSSDIKVSIFTRTLPPDNPYRSYQSRPAVTTQQDPVSIMRKVVPMSIIIIGGMAALLVVAGIFSTKNTVTPNNESDTTSESTKVEISEPVQSDKETLYVDKGNAFFSEIKYDSALWYYEKVLVLNPENKYAIYNKALVFFMKKDFWKSIGIIRTCLRAHPDYNEGLWLLGDDFYELNYYDSAIANLEKAYRNDYTAPDFLELMGDVYLKKNNTLKAIELYKKVIEQDPTKSEVYRYLAGLDPSNADWYRKKADSIDKSIK